MLLLPEAHPQVYRVSAALYELAMKSTDFDLVTLRDEVFESLKNVSMGAATPVHSRGPNGTTSYGCSRSVPCDLSLKLVLPDDRLLPFKVAGRLLHPRPESYPNSREIGVQNCGLVQSVLQAAQ